MRWQDELRIPIELTYEEAGAVYAAAATFISLAAMQPRVAAPLQSVVGKLKASQREAIEKQVRKEMEGEDDGTRTNSASIQ